jgi:hypothetical protein
MVSSRRTLARVVVLAALAVTPVLGFAQHESRADDVANVDCDWNPYKEAWACGLPATFTEGRLNAPPDFRHDEASEASRQKAWIEARSEPGARPRGRMGVFFPKQDGSWWFVPGASWSPGDPVFLPHEKPEKNEKTASR